MPNSVEALIVVGLVLTPGYLCLWFYRQILKSPSKQSDIELILATIALGVLTNGILFPIMGRNILRYYVDNVLFDHQWYVFLWCLLTILVVPTLVGVGLGRAVNSDRKLLRIVSLDSISRTPDAWDFAMNRETGCYVVVYLKNGELIAGTYGQGSFASSDQNRPDLYIEKRWDLAEDGYLDTPERANLGVWLSHDTIARVDFVPSEGETL